MSHPVSRSPTADAAHSLEIAAGVVKACAAAGIKDPLEIPALIAFARAAEEFSAALHAHQLAQRNYHRFIATHGADDPGQDEYVREATAAREIYEVARRAQAVALCTWRAARGLEALRARVAA